MVVVGSSKLSKSQLINIVTSKSKRHIKHVRNYDKLITTIILWLFGKDFGTIEAKNHKINKIKFIYSVIGHTTFEKIKFTGKFYV